MPRGDRTGPRGEGPMTGRAAGLCAGQGMPGYANSMPGRGAGLGRGRGTGRGLRGMRNWFGGLGWIQWGAPRKQQFSTENEKQALKNQAERLQSEMEKIKQRLEEIDF